MSKTDFSKLYKSYYTAAGEPELVTFGPVVYISIAGKGDPSLPEFAHRVQALYTVAYTIKFSYKAAGDDFVVPRLEGLWWYDERKYAEATISTAPRLIPREAWEYLLLLRMPDSITPEKLQAGIASAVEKKDLALLTEVQLHRMEEGKCVQMLHKGPFDQEPATLARIQEFTRAHNLQRNGFHHEIYLSDFRRTAPERLRTILREPVQ